MPYRLVEEFMLLANMAVAHQIYRSFPEQALLRRHPPPQSKLLNDLMEFCHQVGLEIDFSSAGSLHVSAPKGEDTQISFLDLGRSWASQGGKGGGWGLARTGEQCWERSDVCSTRSIERSSAERVLRLSSS